MLGLVVGFGVLSPLWAILSHQWDAMLYMARLWLVGYFDWFAAGMALAVLAWMGAKVSVAFAWPLAAAFFLFSTTTLAGPATLVPDQLSEALWKNVLYLATAAAIMAPLVLREKEPLPDVPIPGARWLRHPALNWLGEISYEFFLIHLIVMEHVMPMLDYNTFQGSTFGVFVVTSAITIPLAWLLRRFTDVITRNPAPPSPWGKRL